MDKDPELYYEQIKENSTPTKRTKRECLKSKELEPVKDNFLDNQSPIIKRTRREKPSKLTHREHLNDSGLYFEENRSPIKRKKRKELEPLEEPLEEPMFFEENRSPIKRTKRESRVNSSINFEQRKISQIKKKKRRRTLVFKVDDKGKMIVKLNENGRETPISEVSDFQSKQNDDRKDRDELKDIPITLSSNINKIVRRRRQNRVRHNSMMIRNKDQTVNFSVEKSKWMRKSSLHEIKPFDLKREGSGKINIEEIELDKDTFNLKKIGNLRQSKSSHSIMKYSKSKRNERKEMINESTQTGINEKNDEEEFTIVSVDDAVDADDKQNKINKKRKRIFSSASDGAYQGNDEIELQSIRPKKRRGSKNGSKLYDENRKLKETIVKLKSIHQKKVKFFNEFVNTKRKERNVEIGNMERKIQKVLHEKKKLKADIRRKDVENNRLHSMFKSLWEKYEKKKTKKVVSNVKSKNEFNTLKQKLKEEEYKNFKLQKEVLDVKEKYENGQLRSRNNGKTDGEKKLQNLVKQLVIQNKEMKKNYEERIENLKLMLIENDNKLLKVENENENKLDNYVEEINSLKEKLNISEKEKSRLKSKIEESILFKKGKKNNIKKNVITSVIMNSTRPRVGSSPSVTRYRDRNALRPRVGIFSPKRKKRQKSHNLLKRPKSTDFARQNPFFQKNREKNPLTEISPLKRSQTVVDSSFLKLQRKNKEKTPKKRRKHSENSIFKTKNKTRIKKKRSNTISLAGQFARNPGYRFKL